jgi:hypothetical protein
MEHMIVPSLFLLSNQNIKKPMHTLHDCGIFHITQQTKLWLSSPCSSSVQPKYHQNAFDDCGVFQNFQAYQDMGLLPPLSSSNSESMRQPHNDCALQNSNSSANHEKRQTKSVMFFRKSAVDSHVWNSKARQKIMM